MTAARAARLDALGFGWETRAARPPSTLAQRAVGAGGGEGGGLEREAEPRATAGRQVINAAPPPEGGGRARAAGEGDDAGWAAQLAKLAAYKATHGDCNVPRGWAEDPKLAKWVKTQRSLKKKLDRGEPCGGVTAARAARLEALGFVWERSPTFHDAGWAVWLTKLAAYKAAHGDCNVPGRWPEDPALGQWVSRQRTLKKKLDRGELCEGRSAARAARLEALGFEWVKQTWKWSDDAGWDLWLAKLAAYKAAHGDCNVPWGWAEGPKLANWVKTQRTLNKKLDRGEPCEGMTAARAARLDALGFDWDKQSRQPSTSWAAQRDRWLKRKLDRERDEGMTAERAARLTALGLVSTRSGA
jgi:hypothetical protein